MCLLIDIGNTRLKWAILQNGRLLSSQSILIGSKPLHRLLDKSWKSLNRPNQVIVSNVAGPTIEYEINDWINNRWNIDTQFIQSAACAHGVTNSYANPQALGVDRWLCLVALRQNYSLPACVIDCGTAVTLDVLDQDGVHLGGLITPGLSLMKESLFKRATGIVETNGKFKGLLGNHTSAAIQNGSLLAVAGMIEKTLCELKSEFQSDLSLIFTGGDADAVSSRVSHHSLIVRDLVLQGLAIYK